MSLLSRKGLLAIGAVVDIALYSKAGPVSARALADRHKLPPRHLEPVLQALVRHGILKGIRGPRGGYELARERRRISAGEVVRAADQGAESNGSLPQSPLIEEVVVPMIATAERVFSDALGGITIDEMASRAELSENQPDSSKNDEYSI